MNDWVRRLSQTGAEQGEALTQLAHVLRERLRRAFRGQPKADSAFIDDVVQNSLTGILESLHQFKGESQFLTWATTLAVRTGVREIRRQRWKDTSLDQLVVSSPNLVASSDLGRNDRRLKHLRVRCWKRCIGSFVKT